MTPLMQEMVDMTNSMTGWDNFGWVRSGNSLGWRSSFDDVDAMLLNVSSISPLLDRMMREAAIMDRLEVVGPAEHMERIKQNTARIAAAVANEDPKYFENLEDVQTGYFRKTPPAVVAPQAAESRPNTMCTMTPHYTIKDWNTARPLMQALLNKSNMEPGCTYYGWAKAGDKLHSRETFVDGAALEAHVAATRPLMDALVKTDAVALDRLELTGPATEMDKVKPLLEDLSPEYLALEGSSPSAQIEGSA